MIDTETTISTADLRERPPYFGLVAVALGLYLSSRYSYLLFHSLVEITTIAIGFSIFIITWNSWKFLKNSILTILGIGYAFVAGLDLIHTFAYKGMNIFSGFDANLPTQLWIAARYLQAITICVAPFLARHVVRRRVACGIYMVITVALTGLIFAGRFPACFIEGKGLTPFKIVSEYIISLILILSLYSYHVKRNLFHHAVYTLTATSIACTALAEISFTAYISVYGAANMVGHLAKLASFYLIYRAILVTGFKEPFDLIFRDLKQTEESLNQARTSLEQEVRARTCQLQSSERRYRSLIDKVQAAIVVHDGTGRIVECNPLAAELLGTPMNQLAGTELSFPGWQFIKEDGSPMPVGEYPVTLVLATGEPVNGYMVGLRRPAGDNAWFLVNAEPERDDDGTIIQVLVSFVEITRLRQTEETLHRLNRQLLALSDCSQALVRANDEQTLLEEICRIVHDDGGYPLVWISYAGSEQAAGVRAAAGMVSGAEGAIPCCTGNGLSPEAWNGTTRCIQDLAPLPENDFRNKALASGYRSCIALPIKSGHTRTFGLLHIFSTAPDAFPPDEVRLLEELTENLAFGIITLRARIERQRAEESLRQSESMLKEAQRIGNLGYWDRDFSAGIITLSAEACRIFGIGSQNERMELDQWYQQWLALVHPEDRPQVAQAYADALAGLSRYDMEYRLVHPDGQERIIKSSAEVTRDEGGRPCRMVGTMQDITEVKQAVELLNRLNEELEVRVRDRTIELQDSQQALMNIVEDLNQKTAELETANNRLLELDRLKSMFIASMSHELRTPLNSIIGFSSIIRNGWIGSVTQEQQENLDIINRAGKHLLTLINDVIDVSKIEAGKIDVNVEEFDLGELLTEAVQYMEKDIRDKGLELKLQVENLRLCTDRRRLMQCIINLVSNAYKFTEQGEITITASASDVSPLQENGSGATGSGKQIRIAVVDTGIGIDEESIPSIYKPFVRLESPNKATIPGTGLGLYLTKKLAVEVLHGTIECHSAAGQGSTFTLTIPGGIYEKGTGGRG